MLDVRHMEKNESESALLRKSTWECMQVERNLIEFHLENNLGYHNAKECAGRLVYNTLLAEFWVVGQVERDCQNSAKLAALNKYHYGMLEKEEYELSAKANAQRVC
jgi:hypothetical protein